jgi:hypothetical protein
MVTGASQGLLASQAIKDNQVHLDSQVHKDHQDLRASQGPQDLQDQLDHLAHRDRVVQGAKTALQVNQATEVQLVPRVSKEVQEPLVLLGLQVLMGSQVEVKEANREPRELWVSLAGLVLMETQVVLEKWVHLELQDNQDSQVQLEALGPLVLEDHKDNQVHKDNEETLDLKAARVNPEHLALQAIPEELDLQDPQEQQAVQAIQDRGANQVYPVIKEPRVRQGLVEIWEA